MTPRVPERLPPLGTPDATIEEDWQSASAAIIGAPASAAATSAGAAVVTGAAKSEAVAHSAEPAIRSAGGTFRSLKVRNYRLYFTGNLISQTGTWMNRVAQDWLVLQLTNDDPVALGIATALQFGPTLLLSLFAGTVADRYDKRRLLIWLQVILGSVGVALGLLATLHVAQIWHVYLACVLVGVAASFDGPVRQAFVMEIVGQREVTNAVALNSMGFNGARIVGPAVAGVLISMINSGPVMMVAGFGYVGVIVGLAMMRPAELVPARKVVRAKGQMREGLHYVAKRRDLLLVMMLLFLVATFGMNFQLTLAIMVKIVFHRDASSYGLLTTTLAVGALLGALVSARRQNAPRQRLLIGSALAFGLVEVALGFSSSYLMLSLLLVPQGIFMLVFTNAANAAVQLTTQSSMRGRVMGIYTLAFLGGTPFVSPLLGVLAEQFGGGAPLVLGGVVSVLAAIVLGTWIARLHHVRVEIRVHPVPHVHLANPLAPDEERVSESLAHSVQTIAGSARRTVRPAAKGMLRAGRMVRRGGRRPRGSGRGR